MPAKIVDLVLLERAQQGHRESLCALAELVREDVLAYLRRLTLDIHVAEDLCQETLVQMLQSLPKLELASERSFWAWLYKTAFSRVSHEFRNQTRTRLRHHDPADIGLLSQIPAREPGGPQALMHQELAAAVCEAMDSITLRYRNILTLRCFQGLSYAEIAVTTGGTELQARLLFLRAKRSLRHELAVRGFRKKAQLLPALTLFAALTAGSSKAAADTLIEAAALKVSTSTLVLGTATSKIRVATLATAAACIVAGVVGLGAFTPHRDEPATVLEPVKNKIIIDATLPDLLRSRDFAGPSAIGKSNAPDNDSLLWADRSSNGPAQSPADLSALLLNKSEQDLRVVILPAGRWIDVRFERPIVDGSGADIIIAGWTSPGPLIEVSDTPGPGMPLRPSTQSTDTSGRTIWGYDLAELPKAVPVTAMRITGVHSQGPHQGFELHDIRARATGQKTITQAR